MPFCLFQFVASISISIISNIITIPSIDLTIQIYWECIFLLRSCFLNWISELCLGC